MLGVPNTPSSRQQQLTKDLIISYSSSGVVIAPRKASHGPEANCVRRCVRKIQIILEIIVDFEISWKLKNCKQQQKLKNYN